VGERDLRRGGFRREPGQDPRDDRRTSPGGDGDRRNRQPNLARQAYDQLKATLTNCLRHGPETQALGVPHFRDHLRGKIAWLTQLHPARGARLLALFEQIRF
jgi:hypothetical protein